MIERPSRAGAWLRSAMRHLAHFLLIIWLSLSLLFVALQLLKGNPVSLFLDPRIAKHAPQLKKDYGYDEGPLKQYLHYMASVSQGDFGISFSFKKPVSQVLPSRMQSSLALGLSAYLTAILLAWLLLLGIHNKRLPFLQKLCGNLHLALIGTPSFVLATILIGLFAVRWPLLPLTGSVDIFAEDLGFWASIWDRIRHAILPTLSLALPLAGQFTAYLDGQLRALDHATFITSARGRGLSERRIFYNHKIRLLLPGIVQIAGFYLPTVAGGTIIIESIFGLPGMGLALFDAVASRDYPLLLGGCIWSAIPTILGYELADTIRERLHQEDRS